MNIPADREAQQLSLILRAWGVPEEQATVTVTVLLEADLRGIESHGIALLPLYDEFRRQGKLTVAPEVRVVRESPVTALIDGGGGLGQFPSVTAMRLAIDKCAAAGVGAVAVRNSNHYGAAGVYASMAPERGYVGLSTSAVYRPAIVPTFGTEPMFGTNPFAFAAPGGRSRPFVLDMATSTAAIGKLKLAAGRGASIPEGWALDTLGRPLSDPALALKEPRLTPLGATRVMGGHKGYGLAATVEILSTMLSGAFYAPTRERRHPGAERYNVGHFFLALDPKAFRDPGEFEADLDDMIDALHAARPADPGQGVLVAGDPEAENRVRRGREGIPVPDHVVVAVRSIAEACGVPFILEAEG
jgi:LDH2 family malate/lactate/ureidoglycolate dehydrogenase